MFPEPTAHVRRFARRTCTLLACAALLSLSMGSAPAVAQDSAAIAAAIKDVGGDREVRRFYESRGRAPMWIENGTIGPAADALLDLIATAEIDGLNPRNYDPRRLEEAVERAAADGSPKSLAKAELALSRAFAAYARDVARIRATDMIYADAELKPAAPSARALLDGAAAAGSLLAHVQNIGWMNPFYGRLRTAAAAHLHAQGEMASLFERDQLSLNLNRARALPADMGKRFVFVDAAAARLWMYENGRAVGSMRVVVGKPEEPTPMMAALIRYANVNPYWNLPPDLVPTRAAEGVLARGPGYLKTKNFEVLSDWSDDAKVIDPATVDWQAVADGRMELRVRQRPGPGNAMGRIKFMFPNDLGIYLHDTPEKELLRAGTRLFSAGCVRVEDAPRLARWLFGKPVKMGGTKETRLDLAEPVPVYITYLTTGVDNGKLVFRPDVYGRDGIELARSGGSRMTSR